jgi:glycosyltransferase involved in cell wall biosynthesis
MQKKIKKHNVLILNYWSFKDALVQTYTLPYVRMIREVLPEGSKIFLTSFEQNKNKMSAAEAHKAKKDLLNDFGVKLLLFKYFNFGPKAFLRMFFVLFRLFTLVIFSKVKTIHCFAPSAGVLGVVLKWFTGRRLVMDSFEPHAEAMVENGTWAKDSFAYRFQFKMEKKMARKAFAVIATTEGMRDYAKSRYNIDIKRFYAKPAGVDLSVFNAELYNKDEIRKELFPNAEIIGIYSGKIGGIYLEEEVFEFLSLANQKWGEKFAFIILTPNSEKEIYSYCKQYSIPESMVKVLFVPHDKVPYYMAAADFAINPVKPVPSKRYCTSIKDGEYWAMGLPVIIPANISDDSEIIRDNKIGYVWNELIKSEYSKSIDWLTEYHKNKTIEIQDKIIKIAQEERDFRKYLEIYRLLFSFSQFE